MVLETRLFDTDPYPPIHSSLPVFLFSPSPSSSSPPDAPHTTTSPSASSSPPHTHNETTQPHTLAAHRTLSYASHHQVGGTCTIFPRDRPRGEMSPGRRLRH